MRSNKTRYFLAELILNCLFFALSASICANLFVSGHLESAASSNISMASIRAQSAAEAIKAADGDPQIYSELMGGVDLGDTQISYYDENWQGATAENFSYALYLATTVDDDGMMIATISVTDDNDLIFELEVRKYIGNGGGRGG